MLQCILTDAQHAVVVDAQVPDGGGDMLNNTSDTLTARYAAPKHAVRRPWKRLPNQFQRIRGALGKHDLVVCHRRIKPAPHQVPHLLHALPSQLRARVEAVRVAKHVALELRHHRVQLAGGIQRRARVVEVVVVWREAAPDFDWVELVDAALVAIVGTVRLQKRRFCC